MQFTKWVKTDGFSKVPLLTPLFLKSAPPQNISVNALAHRVQQ